MIKYISIIMFNCFCYSLVTVSWMHHDQWSNTWTPIQSVHTLYSVSMLIGFCATIKAYKDSKPSPRHGQTRKVAYVRIVCMCLFFVALLILDILEVISSAYCLSYYLLLGCPSSNTIGKTIMLCIRIVYVGTQTVYILWLAPKIRRNETNGLSCQSHLLNVAVNIALLIHNLIVESKDVFHYQHKHPDPEPLPISICLNTPNTNAAEVVMKCWNHTTYLAEKLDQVDKYMRPMITEYFFLASAILISQWLTLAGTTQGDTSETSDQSEQLRPVHERRSDDTDDCEASMTESINLRVGVAHYGTVEQNQPGPPSDNSSTAFALPPRTDYSGTGLNCSFFVMLVMAIITLIVGLCGMQVQAESNLVYSLLLITDLAIGCIILTRMIWQGTRAYRRINGTDQDSRFSYEHLIFLTSSSGIFIHDFAKILPNVVAFFSPQLQRAIADLPHNYTRDFIYSKQSLDIAFSTVDITMAVLVALFAILIHADRKRLYDQFCSSFRPRLWIIILGSFCIWIYRSSELIRVAFTDVQLVPLAFYGHRNWAVILNITNPLSIYFYFHCALVCTEYMVECLTSRPMISTTSTMT